MSFDIQGFKDVFDKVLTVGAPLANLFVPGAGTAISAIKLGVGAIASVFGLKDEEVTPEKMNELAAKDPEFALKMQMANQAYVIELQRQETERLRAETEQLKVQLGDVQDARKRQTDSEKALGKRDYNLYVLAWVLVGGFFGTIIGIIVMKIIVPQINLAADPLLSLLLGSLSTDVGMVVGYFFGSSKSSADKTRLLAQAQPIEPE